MEKLLSKAKACWPDQPILTLAMDFRGPMPVTLHFECTNTGFTKVESARRWSRIGRKESQLRDTVNLNRSPPHLIDLMATCVDLGQAKYPKEIKGKTITPMQGVSLRPALSGKDIGRTEPIFWETRGQPSHA